MAASPVYRSPPLRPLCGSTPVTPPVQGRIPSSYTFVSESLHRAVSSRSPRAVQSPVALPCPLISHHCSPYLCNGTSPPAPPSLPSLRTER
mmetsp:Transcript_18180/g.31389  ORF Transcript_18180/g.31389 Transcript_18180/m.31389 type:complete len:91 (-) Transcript_18180:1330-1602(-)